MSKNMAWYAERYIDKFGFKIVPVDPGKKFPTADDWGNNLLEDTESAKQFYSTNANWNAGISLGASGFCSLDIDCLESFSVILEEFGIPLSELEGLPTIQGASKGKRLLFKVPEGMALPYTKLNWPTRDNEKKKYTVFELRAATDGKQRQDILPPSIHPDTKQPYKWLSQPVTPWPTPPDWLIAIWSAWDSFKPQMQDACPWVTVEPRQPPQERKQPTQQHGGAQVIEAYIAAHSLTSTLERYGYTRKGKKRWLSPHTTTNLPGVILFPEESAAWIHHASDPLCSDDTGHPVNAFDLFKYYEHDGDIKAAVKAAADELGIKQERKTTQTANEAKKQDAPTDTPPANKPYSPFKALGYNGNHYYYLPRGTEQVKQIKAGSHASPTELMSMAPLEWWEMAYPKEKGGADWLAASNDAMRRCETRGIYSQDRERGRGAWFDEGRSVLHLGDRLLVDGKPVEISDLDTAYIYTRQAPLELGADAKPASNEDAKLIASLFDQLNWAKPVHAHLLAGWCVLAPICGGMTWRPHVWLTAQRGAGKAQPLSSKVLTPAGWKLMGDMSVGDQVTTPDNKTSYIRAIYPQGVKQIYKFTFSDGRTARATDDHLWKVRSRGQWKLRTTRELIERVSVDNEFGRSAAIQLAEPLDVERNNKTKLPLHPYVLGALIGDGYFGADKDGKRSDLRITTYDKEIIDRIKRLVPDWMGVFDTKRPFDFNFGDMSKRSGKTRLLIKELKLLGSRSNNKFIPKTYLNGTIKERENLLQGLMDSDGTSEKNGGMSYCTVSRQLADDFCYLVRSLGGSAFIGVRNPKYTYKGEIKNGQKAYVVSVRLKDRSSAFSLSRKIDRVKGSYQYEDSFYLGIKSIDDDGFEEAQCIAIDSPERLYVTDNFVVTHNTWIQDHIIGPMLGPSALMVQGGTTEAGIRQKLKQDARPIVFDEAESEDVKSQSRMKMVLELARGSSSDTLAEIAKGTADGAGSAFRMRSMFLLGSINVSLSQAADESRFSVVTLVKPESTTAERERFESFCKHVDNTLTDKAAASLRARSYRLLPVIRRNAATFAKAAAEKLGSQRIGDQVGALLAGSFSLYRDCEVDIEEARLWIDGLDFTESQDAEQVSDEENCINRMLQTQIRFDSDRGQIQRSIGELVECVSGGDHINGITQLEANSILSRYGFRYDPGYILVSNNHAELMKMLKDTPWGAGWRRILLRIDGAQPGSSAKKFAGSVSRYTKIPIEFFK